MRWVRSTRLFVLRRPVRGCIALPAPILLPRFLAVSPTELRPARLQSRGAPTGKMREEWTRIVREAGEKVAHPDNLFPHSVPPIFPRGVLSEG